MADASVSVDEERTYEVLITELDMVTGACRISLADEPDDVRHEAKITDPASALPNNAYVLAMAQKRPIKVRAKATLKDGEIDRLFISDTAGRKRTPPEPLELDGE